MPEFKFKLADLVDIKANGARGEVDGLFYDHGGAQYRVQYVDGSDSICSIYCRNHEITAVAA